MRRSASPSRSVAGRLDSLAEASRALERQTEDLARERPRAAPQPGREANELRLRGRASRRGGRGQAGGAGARGRGAQGRHPRAGEERRGGGRHGLELPAAAAGDPRAARPRADTGAPREAGGAPGRAARSEGGGNEGSARGSGRAAETVARGAGAEPGTVPKGGARGRSREPDAGSAGARGSAARMERGRSRPRTA